MLCFLPDDIYARLLSCRARASGWFGKNLRVWAISRYPQSLTSDSWAPTPKSRTLLAGGIAQSMSLEPVNAGPLGYMKHPPGNPQRPRLEGVKQPNYNKLLTPALTRLDLLPSLLHELVVAGHGFAHGLQAFTQLLANLDLILDRGAQLLA